MTEQNPILTKKLNRARIIIKANSYYCWFLVLVISLFVLSISAYHGSNGIMIGAPIIGCLGLFAFGLGRRNGLAAMLWGFFTLFALYVFLAGPVTPEYPGPIARIRNA
ncbi:MAG: hypothetical protein JKY49_14055 [Cohaesibacteraceae bacterium]|nr:hypothetical protein [Cohaesibacteraceae bacterium]MBL4876804.1 hypothetical protein [Cohaesibacteraceae bacterium]